MDVEATTAVRQAEVGAARTMIDRTAERFDVTPSRLVGDAGYGSAEMVGWLVDEREIEPHVKLMDKSERTDGTFSRSDFVYDAERDLYDVPAAKSSESTAARSPSPATACRRTANHLSRHPARLQRLRAQAEMLPEHARAQGSALHS